MKSSPRFAIHLAAALVLVAVVCQPVALRARSIVPAGSATTWRYLDSGAPPDASWTQPGFDDSKWQSGKAPLGHGTKRLGTDVRHGAGPGASPPPVTAWFRHEFDGAQLQPGEQLVILICMDDGAVIYLNGHELARANLPKGPVNADTVALHEISESKEGYYNRVQVPAKAIRPGQKNVVAVEVHSASTSSGHLFFDVALKTLPADAPEPVVGADVQAVVSTFNHDHYVGPDVKIPDGYLDGGRNMKLDAASHATSGREILRVDRDQDKELADDLAFARSPELKALPPLERVKRLARHIDAETTPPGGMRWLEKTTEQLQKEFTNKPVLIGDWMDQCQSGVCRHRSLIFKILADEAGLKTALVRGNFASKGPPGIPHAWNELFLDDGRRVLVDVMLKRDKQTFPELTSPEVTEHYLRVDNTPWYKGSTKP